MNDIVQYQGGGMREPRMWEPRVMPTFAPGTTGYPISPLITTAPCVCASDAIGGRMARPDCWACKGSMRVLLARSERQQ